jgi:hypothetical protein
MAGLKKHNNFFRPQLMMSSIDDELEDSANFSAKKLPPMVRMTNQPNSEQDSLSDEDVDEMVDGDINSQLLNKQSQLSFLDP